MDSLTKTLLQVNLGGSAWVLWLLLGLSVASLAVMFERGWVYFRHRWDENHFVPWIKLLLDAGCWPKAINLC